MDFKPCTIYDLPIMMAVSTQSYSDHYLYLWHDEGREYIQSSFSHEQFTKELKDPNALFYLIYYKSAPVGLIKLNIDKGIENYSSQSAMELERIYIIKSATGRGLGKKAIDFVTGLAKDKNKSILWLKTMDSSDAMGFYTKLGFQTIAQTRLDYINMKEEYRGMYIMSKEI